MNLDLSTLVWKDISIAKAAPRSYLLTTIVIDGVSHGLLAAAVLDVDDGIQVTVDQRLIGLLEMCSAVNGTDGPLQTVKIEGHDYILIMTPFNREVH